MPLWKLQTVGEERLEFLYENLDRGGRITLKPGIAYCFRGFYGLLRDLIEGAWIRFVQRLNAEGLGNLADLGTFLFAAAPRSQVDIHPLVTLPRRPRAQFVLAHDRCNNAKSDHLAAEDHLAAWVERNSEHRAELHERLLEASLPSDPEATVQVARWVYQQTESPTGRSGSPSVS